MDKKGMAPLWLMYPHIPNGSIGWRMGYGESYGDEFYRWFHTLSREEKEEYMVLFSHREDIPDELKLTVEQVIESIC